MPFLSLLFFSGCDTEDAPDCFQTSGKMIEKELQVEAFDELIVYEGINLFIEQGAEQKVLLKPGKTLLMRSLLK